MSSDRHMSLRRTGRTSPFWHPPHPGTRRRAYVPGPRPSRDWTQILVIVLPSILTAIALIFTWRTVGATYGQLQTAQQGQITDRYNAAITNLGSLSVDVRLGGIYALQRIMQDSPRDQPTIVAVLCAFVRDHANAAAVKSARPLPPLPNSAVAYSEVPTDIKAALTVVGTRNTTYDGSTTVVDLTDVDLSGMSLPSESLAGANLTDADLDHAYLYGANLTDANLTEANLANAVLSGAHLHNAALYYADLNYAQLSYADLTDAKITGLTGVPYDVDVPGADLEHADLFGANLTSADLHYSDLTDADLTDANLTNADFQGTGLTGAILVGAKLTGAKGIPSGGRRLASDVFDSSRLWFHAYKCARRLAELGYASVAVGAFGRVIRAA